MNSKSYIKFNEKYNCKFFINYISNYTLNYVSNHISNYVSNYINKLEYININNYKMSNKKVKYLLLVSSK